MAVCDQDAIQAFKSQARAQDLALGTFTSID